MFRQFLLVLFVASFALSLPQNAYAAKKVAFLVGVNQYKKPGFRNLSYAERDVSEMSKQLKTFGFDVSLILGKDATKSNLDTTINKLVAPLSKEDLILVMLTGHGVQRAGGDAYYCPYDAISENDGTLFSLSKLLKTTLAPNVGTKLLLIDACRNDPDPGRGRSAGIQGKRVALPEDTAVMFSCKAGQQSFENDEIKHGVFTYCLLDALRGAAAYQGDVSWFGLVSYVNRKMASSEIRRYIPKNRIQTPIPAGGVPFTVLTRVEVAKPKFSSKPSLIVAPFSEDQANAKRKEWATYLKKEEISSNSIGMKFNLIPPGEFKMGRMRSIEESAEIYESEKKLLDDEFPSHKVQITKPFYVGITEVTQSQWRSIMGSEPWKGIDVFKAGNDYAATCITWDDAQKFIEKLNRKENAKYRLPTEAEWEFVCRAGSENEYSFGDSQKNLGNYAWFSQNADEAREPYAHRVGLKFPNNFGLFDVHGNVCEWCSDRYGKIYYQYSPTADPSGPVAGTNERVLRGGGWHDGITALRCAQRRGGVPAQEYTSVGFRLVMMP